MVLAVLAVLTYSLLDLSLLNIKHWTFLTYVLNTEKFENLIIASYSTQKIMSNCQLWHQLINWLIAWS